VHAIVVVYKENVLSVDVCLGESMDFSVEKISKAEVAAREMLNVVGEVFGWRVIVECICEGLEY
jgi:hypothetical protein